MTDRALRVLSHIPEGLLQPLRERFPSVELRIVPEEGALPTGTRGEVLLTYTWGSPNFADFAPCGVRWVHGYGTGVDGFPFESLGDRQFSVKPFQRSRISFMSIPLSVDDGCNTKLATTP